MVYLQYTKELLAGCDEGQIMKTSDAKKKLMESLRSLPGDFSLSTTRQHIVNALKSIQKYEERYADKKSKDLDLHQQWWGGIVANTVNQPTANYTKETISQSLKHHIFHFGKQ